MRIAMRKLTKQEIEDLENIPLYPTGESIPVDCKVGLPKCYNCGEQFELADYYLIVKDENGEQFLYDDVYCKIKPTDKIYEFEICPHCGAAV